MRVYTVMMQLGFNGLKVAGSSQHHFHAVGTQAVNCQFLGCPYKECMCWCLVFHVSLLDMKGPFSSHAHNALLSVLVKTAIRITFCVRSTVQRVPEAEVTGRNRILVRVVHFCFTGVSPVASGGDSLAPSSFPIPPLLSLLLLHQHQLLLLLPTKF